MNSKSIYLVSIYSAIFNVDTNTLLFNIHITILYAYLFIIYFIIKVWIYFEILHNYENLVPNLVLNTYEIFENSINCMQNLKKDI